MTEIINERHPVTEHQSDGIVRVRREVKGRGGKTVTTVSGIPLDEPGIRELASQFKRRLGTGGAVKDGVMILQGDYSGVIIAELTKQGFKVKRSGG
jgi:translation initiation factor 1